MEKKYVYNLLIFENRLHKINKALLLLDAIKFFCDERNHYQGKNRVLSRAFNVNERTIREWLKILSENGAIKYNYSGTIRLNPFFYYYGEEKDYDDVVQEWLNFKSVNPARQKEYTLCPA